MSSVLIVGAGPTGLTLACDLARRGVPVRIIEKLPGFQHGSRGKSLNARSLEVLADLGVAEPLRTGGITHLPFRKYFNGDLVDETDPFGDRMLFVPQWRTEQILRDKLAGYDVRVELGAELVGLTHTDDVVVATLADGGRIEAGYLVGCDGGRSSVRKLLGVCFDGDTAQEQAMVCGDVEIDGLGGEFWYQWFDDDGAVLLCPFRGTASWQFQASPERDAAGDPVEPSLASFRRLFDRHARIPGVRLRNLTWTSTWRVNVRMVDRYRVGRVLLAGDAAHVHPIAGGLGMNTGIQDAWNLGWKLGLAATGRAGPALLDTYQEERLPVAAWTLGLSTDRMRVVLDAIKIPGQGMDAVAVPEGAGLGITYRRSAADGGCDGELQAGDRAPEALCHDADGTATRLYDVFAGGYFTLLGFGSQTRGPLRDIATQAGGIVRACAVDAGPDALADRDGNARRAYGIVGDTLVLVRPDHHVAVIATAADAGAVSGYFRGLGR